MKTIITTIVFVLTASIALCEDYNAEELAKELEAALAEDTDEKFESARAQRAHKKFQKEMEDIKKELEKRIEKAKEEYVDELDYALKHAMKTKDLEEANKINEEKEKLVAKKEDKKDEILINNEWVYTSDHAFKMTFGHDGEILEGKNNFEHHYKIDREILIIYTSKDKIQTKLFYNGNFFESKNVDDCEYKGQTKLELTN